MVTLGDIRKFGCRKLLVYCANAPQCSHGVKIDADQWPDEFPIKSLEPRMVCTRCGFIGADVRPDWDPHTQSKFTPGG